LEKLLYVDMLYINSFVLILVLTVLGMFVKVDIHSKTNNDRYDMLFCAVCAIAIGTLCGICPLKEKDLGYDSPVWLYIGQRMQEGYVPYRDIFDHKGIVLFFIQFFGLLLTPNSLLGVWFLELINMFFTAFFCLKTAKLVIDNKIINWLTVAWVLLVCAQKVFDRGNFTEEYALPWISLAIFVFLQYICTDKYKFTQIIALGVGFAYVAFLRLNMVSVWVFYLPIIFFQMIRKKEWKNLGNCIVAFACGMLIVLVPILAYTIATDSFDDMVKNYFVFNLSYADSEGTLESILSNMMFLSSRFIPALVAIAAVAYKNQNNRVFLVNLACFFVALFFASISGRQYSHYAMVLLPLLVVPIGTAINDFYRVACSDCFSDKRVIALKKHILVVLCASLVPCFIGMKPTEVILDNDTAAMEEKMIVSYLTNNTKESDDVLILGSGARFYILADRKTENKYCYQTPPINISDEIYLEFMNEVIEHPSDTVVLARNREQVLKEANNFSKVVEWFDKQSDHNIYQRIELENYCIYEKVE